MQDGYTIREATSLELTEVAEVLARAFENDPAYGRITSKISANAFEALREIFIFQLRRHFIPEGLIDVVESPDGRIVAVALWDGPGRHSTLAAQLGMLGDYVRILGKEIPASVLREARTAKYQPRFSHWYLHLVATAPEAQGQGLGQTLIEEGLARAGDGAVYLEATTPRSAALYARLGFVPLGAIRVDGFSMYELAMWRPPAFPTDWE